MYDMLLLWINLALTVTSQNSSEISQILTDHSSNICRDSSLPGVYNAPAADVQHKIDALIAANIDAFFAGDTPGASFHTAFARKWTDGRSVDRFALCVPCGTTSRPTETVRGDA